MGICIAAPTDIGGDVVDGEDRILRRTRHLQERRLILGSLRSRGLFGNEIRTDEPGESDRQDYSHELRRFHEHELLCVGLGRSDMARGSPFSEGSFT